MLQRLIHEASINALSSRSACVDLEPWALDQNYHTFSINLQECNRSLRLCPTLPVHRGPYGRRRATLDAQCPTL
jgi:hypothetical protein